MPAKTTTTKKPATPSATILKWFKSAGMKDVKTTTELGSWFADAEKADKKAKLALTRPDGFLQLCFEQFRYMPLDKIWLLKQRDLTPAKIAKMAPAPRKVTAKKTVLGVKSTTLASEFETTGLTKDEFLTKNKTRLLSLLTDVNAALKSTYGANFKSVSPQDLWVVFYCECGLKKTGGLVDPDHTHSEGERGLLPLPSNIKAWNGPDAPQWDKPMTVQTNLTHFFIYMGHLKNKDQTGNPRHLYKNLFLESGISENAERESKVLAGVIHGYFYKGTYSDATMPYDYLLAEYKKDTPLAAMMEPTKYVHAGKPLMVGREKNIETALGLV